MKRFIVVMIFLTAGLPASALGYHSADTSADGQIELSELLRIIQFYNSAGFHCAEKETEDGYMPGVDHDREDCLPHDSDCDLQDWKINLSELLRLIQFFNSSGYYPCPDLKTEDGFCPLEVDQCLEPEPLVVVKNLPADYYQVGDKIELELEIGNCGFNPLSGWLKFGVGPGVFLYLPELCLGETVVVETMVTSNSTSELSSVSIYFEVIDAWGNWNFTTTVVVVK